MICYVTEQSLICLLGSESEDEVDITHSVAEGLKKFRQDHEEAERRRNEIKRRLTHLSFFYSFTIFNV